jgi:2-methylcitrate dehydratase
LAASDPPDIEQSSESSSTQRAARSPGRHQEDREQDAGVRIIDKTGPLANFADRDHCLQYMIAVPMIFGRLTAEDYSDAVAADPRIDALREKMAVRENPRFTRDYFDPEKRYIGNAIQVRFKDGSSTDRISIDSPIGHRERRGEGVPVLLQKFEAAIGGHLPAHRVRQILDLVGDPSRFESIRFTAFLGCSLSEPGHVHEVSVQLKC